MERKIVDLGWPVVIVKNTGYGSSTSITIMQEESGGTNEEDYTAAASITIFTKERLEKLKEAIDLALKDTT